MIEYAFFGEGPLVDSLRAVLDATDFIAKPADSVTSADEPTTGDTDLASDSVHSAIDQHAHQPESAIAATGLSQPTRTVAVLALDTGDFSRAVVEMTAARRSSIDMLVDSVIAATRRGNIDHIVVLSSAAVYGAWRDRIQITDEDTRVDFLDAGWVGDLVYGEARLAQALQCAASQHESAQAAPQPVERTQSPVPVTVLRAASLVGPELDTMITRHFEVPRLLELRDSAKHWQFLHVDDLATAIELVAQRTITGTITVGAVKEGLDGVLVPDCENTKTVATIAGRRTVSLSENTAMSTALRLHRVGVLAVPASDIAYAVHPWTVLPQTLIAHGWRSEYSTAECVRQIAAHVTARTGVAGGMIRRRSVAALGAAGAAVAVAGTIAAMRRSRGVS